MCTAQRSLYEPHSGQYMYRTVVTICTTSLTFNNSTFCPHTVFMCFVWISEQTAIISLYKMSIVARGPNVLSPPNCPFSGGSLSSYVRTQSQHLVTEHVIMCVTLLHVSVGVLSSRREASQTGSSCKTI